MKFIHIADVHLGATPDAVHSWGKEREKEIWDSFHRIITICNEEKVDLLLIAGDLFHKQPLVRELKELNYCFSKLKTAQVVIMAGNHDYIGPRSNYQGFQWDKRVHMFMKENVEVIELPEIDTEVYGLSYQTREITMPCYHEVKCRQSNRFQILLAHGGDEKHIPYEKKRLLEKGFDYIALGHIHKPEIISERMAYAGSMEPLDKNETGQRGYIQGEIHHYEKGNETKIKFKPNACRQYIPIVLITTKETTNGQLLDMVNDAMVSNGPQNLYLFYIKGVRDENIIFHTKEILALGNVIEVIDETVPDYDFDALFRENQGNLIGLYIQRIRETKDMDVVSKKALYYGMEALIGAQYK